MQPGSREEVPVKTIRELREAKGITQLELAIALGVTPVTVYNWERGKYEPRASQFRELARVFDVPMESIRLVGANEAQGSKLAA